MARRLVTVTTTSIPTMTPSETSVGISGTPGQIAVRPVQDELDADEGQDDGQAVAEVHQPAQRTREHEVERAQAEQGEGVGGEDEVRVLGDAVDGGHRVDGEDDVGGEHGDDHQGERGQRPPAVLPDGQPRCRRTRRLTGMNRRSSRTERIVSTSTSCSWPERASRSIFDRGDDQDDAPKSRKAQSKVASAAAPRAMKTPRSTSAPTMP